MNDYENVNAETMTAEQIEELIREMRGAERGTAYRISRVKATIHLNNFWLQLQGQDTPFEERKVLRGQIVAGIILRNLYREGVKHPLCSSTDAGVHGTLHQTVIDEGWDIGIPDGQSCATCPWNVFGSVTQWQADGGDSNKPGKGKACKERRALAMLLPDVEGPIVVYLPTKSMIPWDAYADGLDRLGDSYIKQVTEIGIDLVTENNNTYGVANFKSVGKVPQVQIASALLDKRKVYVPLLSAQARVTQIEPMESASVPADSDAAWEAMGGLDAEQSPQPF